MIIMERLYVNWIDVRRKRIPKDIYIFGAGTDGHSFFIQENENLKLHGYIDNAVPAGQVKELDGLCVRNAAEALSKGVDGHILVVSRSYEMDMCKQLNEAGLKPGRDYHVWDWSRGAIDLEHIYSFIDHNEYIWSNFVTNKGQNKVLCTISFCLGTFDIFNSYYTQLLAKKYNAEIVVGLIKYSMLEHTKQVYESFGVSRFLLMELTEAQEQCVNTIFEEIWPTTKTKYDWLKIKIRGLNVGKEIYHCIARNVTGVYDFEKYEMDMRKILLNAIKIIVYYDDYFRQNEIKAVVLGDGVCEEGYVSIIANHYGAKVYGIYWGRVNRLLPDKGTNISFDNYAKTFKTLPQEEQDWLIAGAKKELNERLGGGCTEISNVSKSPFSEKISGRLLDDNGRLKVLIMPHSLCDYSNPYGDFMFADHEDWLEFLGEISERTDYDWYIKYHPIAGDESTELWDDIVRRYPRIKKLPLNISPKQLRNEGIEFALTLWGSCAYEYPLLGVQVIAAGEGPHRFYDFSWNPETKKQYEELLLNLPSLKKEINIEQIYQFYAMHMIYDGYPGKSRNDIFFPVRQMHTKSALCPMYVDVYGRLVGYQELYFDWGYKWFLDEFSKEHHEKLLFLCNERLNKADILCEQNTRV